MIRVLSLQEHLIAALVKTIIKLGVAKISRNTKILEETKGDKSTQ